MAPTKLPEGQWALIVPTGNAKVGRSLLPGRLQLSGASHWQWALDIAPPRGEGHAGWRWVRAQRLAATCCLA